jgi:hypothetical protein
VRWRTAKLKLTVTDATNNQPIHDVLLYVSPGDRPGLWLTVEPLLSYRLPPQVPSLTKLKIVVTAKGYSSTTFTFPSLAPGETHEIVTKLTPKGLGCISGVAVDENYSPVSAAKISPRFMGRGYASDQASPVTADDHGKFTLSNLRLGDYVLWPEKESEGFSGNWSGWSGQVELQRATVTPGECQQVTVNMGPRGALIRVRAIDRTTHAALTNINVSFQNPQNPRQGGSIIGAAREPHELLVPSHTTVVVQVQASGYEPSERVTIGPLSSGEVQDLTLPMQPNPTSGSSRQ